MEESALRALREKLFAHSSDILVEFKKRDKDETGKTNQVKYSQRKKIGQKPCLTVISK